ncbi:hypothetical protein JXM67_11200 [candidate division WOR-3 bacterium]|nr:hypothetical protein [candidate division WOR-3 bacterium]
MKITVRVLTALLIMSSLAVAHKPLSNPPGTSDFSGAIEIEEPDVSYVVYHEVTEERPRVWLRLEAEAGYNLYVSLGVPVIDRLTDYHPAVAVIGPGLPDKEFDFQIPHDMGAVVFTTDDIDEPRFFHEPFTGTDSWIYVEEWLTLPETGTYYVVAYHPENTPGKLWVAPGTKERWGIIDIFTLPSIIKPVRKFHERR